MSSNCYYCGGHPDEVIDLRRRCDELEHEAGRAWNEAIEAAAKLVENYGPYNEDKAAKIRALNR